MAITLDNMTSSAMLNHGKGVSVQLVGIKRQVRLRLQVGSVFCQKLNSTNVYSPANLQH
jgi:hypothetical protein